MRNKSKIFDPLHPGEVLLEEYLKPAGISQNQLALSMRVSPQRISEIVNGKRAITAVTATRLAKTIGTSAQFWMSLQADYDLHLVEMTSGEQIANEVIPIPL